MRGALKRCDGTFQIDVEDEDRVGHLAAAFAMDPGFAADRAKSNGRIGLVRGRVDGSVLPPAAEGTEVPPPSRP